MVGSCDPKDFCRCRRRRLLKLRDFGSTKDEADGSNALAHRYPRS